MKLNQSSSNEKMQQIGNTASNIERNIDNGMNRATDQAKQFANSVKDDYKANIGNGMNNPSKFGFKLYMYAILLFSFFVVRNSTAIILLTGWVIVVEKNRDLAKMCISTIALYALMDVVFDVSYDVLNLIGNLICDAIKLNVVYNIGSKIRTVASTLSRFRDIAYAFVGFTSLMKAKNGGYYKIAFIENLFIK